MLKREFENTVNSIISNGNLECGLVAYVLMKQGNRLELKKLLLDTDLTRSIKGKLKGVIDEQYLADEVKFDDISNIIDNKKNIYVLEQNNEYCPFEFLSDINQVNASFQENNYDNIMGFIFKINLNDNSLYIYQQAYSGTKLKNNNVLHIVNKGSDCYGVFNKNLLRIDKRAEIIIVENKLYIKKFEVLQDKFGFQVYARKEADKVITQIRSLDIVTNIDKIVQRSMQPKLTTAKKLMKIKNSPVLRMEKEDLVDKLNTIPRYKSMVTIENGKIKTNSIGDVNNFLKILNDDILISELTKQEYDSQAKKKIEALVE